MPTLAEVIGGQVEAALVAAFNKVEPQLDKISKDAGDAAHGGVLGDVGTLVDIVKGVLEVSLLAELGPLDALVIADKVQAAGGRSGRAVGIGYLLGYAAFSMMAPVFLPVQHAIANILQTGTFDPDTAARVVSRGIASHAWGLSESQGNNFDEQHFDMLVDDSQNWPAMAEFLEMVRRDLLGPNETQKAFDRTGAPAELQAVYLALKRNLLSAADLALAFLRTDITAETMQGYADQLGITPADMQLLVGNTGEPLAPEELNMAYRREIIDQARLLRGYRQSRIRNEWDDVALALRFAPMSTADAARAVVEGYMTPADGANISQQNGLLPAHWSYIYESWGRPLAHEQMLSLYYRGLASRDQVNAAFRQSDIKPEYEDQSFDLGRRLLPVYEIVNAIKYKVLSLTDGLSMLLQQGYNESDAAVLVKLGAAEAGTTAKALTQAQVVSAYEQHVYTRAEALTALEALKYSAHDAAALLAVADAKVAAAALKTETTAVRDRYMTGSLTSTQAETELEAFGVTVAQAQHLVSIWSKEGGEGARALTEAQTLKAAKEQIITTAAALTRLEALGFTKADATILLKSEGLTVG